VFQPTYIDARRAFRKAIASAGWTHEALTVVDGDTPQDTLTIDVATFGSGPRVLGLSSGLHGVEGFAGSAIQLQLLAQDVPSDIRFVIFHVLNPFGMHHIRRVNESNVDLNRNFLPPDEAYTGCTDEYHRLDSMLNPARPTRSLEFMIPQAICQILRHGMPALKTALVGGQYAYPKGLFFGGARLERGPKLFMDALPRLYADAERIVHIDFHTGLGQRGTHALLVDTPAGSADHIRLRQVHGDRIQPWDAGHGVAYKIRGGLPDAIQRAFPGRTDVLTCEFGTVAALKVIDALRAENQAAHWGGQTAKAKAKLLAAFRPASKSWERAILAGGDRVVQTAITHLQSA
jgi:hypothetical protein